MNNLDRFGYTITFENICYVIENKRTDLNENFKIYLDNAKKFFKGVVKGLESLIKGDNYFIVEYIKEIVDAFGYQIRGCSKEDIEKMVKGFNNTIIQLDELEKNPEQFYKTKNATELLKISKNLLDIYSPNITFFEHEDFIA